MESGREHFAGIEKVVRLSSDRGYDLEEEINEYLQQGYRLLHIGQETGQANGNTYQLTVAFLGK